MDRLDTVEEDGSCIPLRTFLVIAGKAQTICELKNCGFVKAFLQVFLVILNRILVGKLLIMLVSRLQQLLLGQCRIGRNDTKSDAKD